MRKKRQQELVVVEEDDDNLSFAQAALPMMIAVQDYVIPN